LLSGHGLPVEALRRDHQAGQDFFAVERRVGAELAIERLLDALGRKLRHEIAAAQERRLEELLAELPMDRVEQLDRHPARQAGRENRARRGAADQIEVVAEPELRRVQALAKEILDHREVLQRQNPTNPAAVESENALRSGGGFEVLLLRVDDGRHDDFSCDGITA
jgi:hypothetical protein